MTGTDRPVRCKDCDRPLRSPESVARRRGPVCARREAARTADFTQEQVIAARQLLAAGAVTRTRRDASGPMFTVVTGPYTRYWTTAHDCTCDGARRYGLCRHMAAVRIRATQAVAA